MMSGVLLSGLIYTIFFLGGFILCLVLNWNKLQKGERMLARERDQEMRARAETRFKETLQQERLALRPGERLFRTDPNSSLIKRAMEPDDASKI
jgi:hypothetical protein